MSWFDYKKRKIDGKKGADDSAGLDQQRPEMTRVQKRQCFRVFYPAAATPEVLNFSAKVIDLSVKAVRFERGADALNFSRGDKINIVLKLHDEQIIERTGYILRQTPEQAEKNIFVCIFTEEIPLEVINKEQAYLLKNFPDFCRDKFKF